MTNEYGSHTFCRTLELGVTVVVENEASNDWIVFPNPAQDQVFLKVKNDPAFFGTWQLYNSLGQLLGTNDIQSSLTTISTKGLAKGVYFYILEKEGDVVAEGKLVLE